MLTDDSKFEELGCDSDYREKILNKSKIKNNGGQSDTDEEDDIPTNKLMQEPVNQSDVTTGISQDPRVNNEQETVSIYQWRKNDIEYLDVSFKEPALSPDLHDILSPYKNFKLFLTTEMLQTMAFESNRYSLKRFGEDMKIPCTVEELQEFIGCYFQLGIVKMLNQRSFWEEYFSCAGFSQSSQEIRLKHLLELFMLQTIFLWMRKQQKIRPWLESLQQNFLKVSIEQFNSVGKIMVSLKGRSYLRQYLRNKPHKWGFEIWEGGGVCGLFCDIGVYQGCSNKFNSTFGVTEDVVASL